MLRASTIELTQLRRLEKFNVKVNRELRQCFKHYFTF